MLSPRHRAPLSTLDQFPEPPWSETHRASHPTVPVRRHRAAQSAQSMQPVPVHPRPVKPRFARTPARHRATDATTPSPCTAMHRHAPTAHRFTHCRSETTRVAAKPASHRHRLHAPWTWRTMPSQHTAHDAQSRPMMSTLNRVYPDSIKLETPSGILPSHPFAPSPLSLTCRTSPPCSRGKSVAGELESIG
jgi:hypothetical protein